MNMGGVKFMALYFVNTKAKANGDHEIHKAGCLFMPDNARRQYLGNFSDSADALHEAQQYFNHINGCFYCSHESHNTEEAYVIQAALQQQQQQARQLSR